MVGQNLLLELVEGDKVQLYVYTGAGISDHKNSHYTQFIGCLLRPSVETLHAVMRRLGSSEALEDDVSTADGDISRRINGNGDASLMGRSRRGGSKNRVLSPPPQPNQAPANQNSAASTSDVTNEVIKEEVEEPPTPIENGQNGHNHEKNEAKDQKSQSYLALTKLGMGGNNKKSQNGNVEENNNKKESPKEGKKNKEVNGKTKKSMAEMASSTLKGFTKM